MTEQCITIAIQNKKGLHARAAAKFVKVTGKYDVKIQVAKIDEEEHPAVDSAQFSTVSGTSILGLMMLAADCGSTIRISAEGPQAAEALRELEDLLNRKFDEGE